MRHWEIIADKLNRADWSLGWVSAMDSEGRTLGIVDAHRDDGKRFVVHADEKVTAFTELESVIRACDELTHAYEALRVGLTRKSNVLRSLATSL